MEAGLLSFVMTHYTGPLGFVLGVILVSGHFWVKYRQLKLQGQENNVSEAEGAIRHLSEEVRYLAEENRKLRQEILDLRETYVELHERYLTVLQELSELK